MMTSQHEWTFRRVASATLVIVSIAFGFWLIYRFYQVLFILLVAIVIGTVIRPVVSWLNKRGLSRLTGVILVYFLFLIFVVGFVLLLYPLIADQVGKIAGSVPEYYQSFHGWMVNNPNEMIIRLSEYLPNTLSFGKADPSGQQVIASAEQALGYVKSAANGVFLAIAILLLALYWTLDGTRTIQSLLQLIPKDKRENISDLIQAMESKIGYFIAGQGVLCLVIGTLALIAYLSIGLPNALVLALVAGIMEAVPMIGPTLGAIPAAVVALSIAPTKLIWVVGATIIIQILENNLLVPRVMRKAVGVNPFVSLLSIFAFSTLFGIGGALMAIPIAAIIQLLLDRFVFNTTKMDSEVAVGRDIASRLRYEVQELALDLRKQARVKKGGSDLKIKQVDHVMDEIEKITTDLDALLAEVHTEVAQ